MSQWKEKIVEAWSVYRQKRSPAMIPDSEEKKEIEQAVNLYYEKVGKLDEERKRINDMEHKYFDEYMKSCEAAHRKRWYRKPGNPFKNRGWPKEVKGWPEKENVKPQQTVKKTRKLPPGLEKALDQVEPYKYNMD